MRDNLQLTSTASSYHSVYESVDKVRRNSKTVTVPRQALQDMLVDFSKLAAKVHECGIRVDYNPSDGI